MVDDLRKRKAELLDLISKHKAAISPLRYFPPELLVEIFEYAVAMVHAHLFMEHPLPLMLMEVCTRWRRIVLDTPRLWTRILANYPVVDSWITRSRELPLRIELDLSSAASAHALGTLIPHSHRRQLIDICLYEPNSDILECVGARLDSLESLNLSFAGIQSGIVDFCEVAPQLTKLELRQIYEPVIIKLPWEQLRVCTTNNTKVARYVLQHAKNLRKLHLDRIDLFEHNPLVEPVMPDLGSHSHHLGLNVLIIKWTFGEDLDLFSPITLPSLQTLQVCLNYDPHDVTSLDSDRTQLAPTLAGFFERSCVQLGTLEFIGIPFSQGELVECLAFLPSLVSLDIQFDNEWHEIDGGLLDGLRLDANRPSYILPRLRSPTLRWPFGMSIGEPLDNLIASRRHINQKHDGVALLEDLTLKFPPFQPEELPRYHHFVSEGLDISSDASRGLGWV